MALQLITYRLPASENLTWYFLINRQNVTQYDKVKRYFYDLYRLTLINQVSPLTEKTEKFINATLNGISWLPQLHYWALSSSVCLFNPRNVFQHTQDRKLHDSCQSAALSWAGISPASAGDRSWLLKLNDILIRSTSTPEFLQDFSFLVWISSAADSHVFQLLCSSIWFGTIWES